MTQHTTTKEKVMEITQKLKDLEFLQTEKQIAIQFYLKGMLDSNLINEMR